MTALRIALGALGLAAGAYGLVLLIDQGSDNLLAAGTWLVVGVLLHDGVLGPVTILLGVVGARLLRRPVPAPVVVGAVVLGSVTLLAVPVLGRYGARADNPTLLDRDYTAGWLVLAALTLVLVLAALLRERRTPKGGGDGARPGRR